MNKLLEIDAEMDKVLTGICDAALKQGGMQIFGLVSQVVASIKPKED